MGEAQMCARGGRMTDNQIQASEGIGGLTYDYSKDGMQLRRQLDKKILSNTGVWADIAFLHQDKDMATGGWKPSRITIARFKRVGGIWKKQNHFNVNSAERADGIANLLRAWCGMIGSTEEE
jgi:hypothetical protein